MHLDDINLVGTDMSVNTYWALSAQPTFDGLYMYVAVMTFVSKMEILNHVFHRKTRHFA